MTRLRATLLTPALLAGLAGAGLGGCALDTDTGDPEQSAPVTARPPPGETDPDPAPGTDTSPGEGDGHSTCDDGCTSTMPEFGLVCTTCPGDGDAAPECLVGTCNVVDHCLECTDPKGHVGVDCSLDYEAFPTASFGVGGGDTFDVCDANWGLPGGSIGSCQYPGNDTCSLDEFGCIQCTFPDGSGTGLCGDDLPTDFLVGRPSTLPAPGECANELGPDGAIVCSTCTRDDLGAIKVCRFPPAESCDFAGGDDPIEKCVACALVGGGVAEVCDDAGT